MDIKPNPFSLYDFLGYLIPGAIFIYGFLLVLNHVYLATISLSSIATQLHFEKEEIYIIFILVAYVWGHILSFLSSITIERYSIWAHGYPSKYLLGVKKSDYFPKGDKLRCVIRFIVGLGLFPIVIMDWILGAKAGMRDLYAKPLDELLINLLRNKIDLLMASHAEVVPDVKEHGGASETDFFRYAYHYAVENAPNHLAKMQNYVALYGFLRTLTLIAVLTFWDLFWHATSAAIPLSISLWLMLVATIFTYLLFMAFVKFYRRFSLEALMAMSVTITKKTMKE